MHIIDAPPPTPPPHPPTTPLPLPPTLSVVSRGYDIIALRQVYLTGNVHGDDALSDWFIHSVIGGWTEGQMGRWNDGWMDLLTG